MMESSVENTIIGNDVTLEHGVDDHGETSLTIPQWKTNLGILVDALNKQIPNSFSLSDADLPSIIFTDDNESVTFVVQSWGNITKSTGAWSSDLIGCQAITIQHGIVKPNDMHFKNDPIKRVTAKNVNVMIIDEVINEIATSAVETLEASRWKGITDCEKSDHRAFMANWKNWKEFVQTLGKLRSDETTSMSGARFLEQIEDKPVGGTNRRIMFVRQPPKLDGHGLHNFDQITMDRILGVVSTDDKHPESSDEIRTRLQKLLDSGIELTTMSVGVAGKADEIRTLAKSITADKNVLVEF